MNKKTYRVAMAALRSAHPGVYAEACMCAAELLIWRDGEPQAELLRLTWRNVVTYCRSRLLGL